MKEKAIIVLSSCLLIGMFSVMFYFRNDNNNNNNTASLNSCLNDLSLAEYELNTIKRNLEKQLFSDYTIIDSTIIVLNMAGNEIYLKSLINTPKLVYTFTETTCIACVYTDLEIINNLGDIVGSNNILIIGRYDNFRRFKVFAMQNISKSNYYYLTTPYRISLEDTPYDSPFYFILSKDLQIHFAYIGNPDDNYESYYFKRITQFLNESNQNSNFHGRFQPLSPTEKVDCYAIRHNLRFCTGNILPNETIIDNRFLSNRKIKFN